MTARLSERLQEKAQNRTTAQALRAIRDAGDVPTLRELVFEIGQEVTNKQIAAIIADRLKNGSPNEKRVFAATYIDMLARLQKMEGEITEDDAMKMADEQIEEMLAEDYGESFKGKLTRRGPEDYCI